VLLQEYQHFICISGYEVLVMKRTGFDDDDDDDEDMEAVGMCRECEECKLEHELDIKIQGGPLCMQCR
jgi:hypothetical protein